MTSTLFFLRNSTTRLTSILPLLALLVFTGCDKTEKVTAEAPAVEVVAITIEPQTVPAVFSFIAQIQSSHQVDVTARVNGFLDKISYREGESVQQGQVLFQLDQKPFVAAADAAKAEMEVRKSQLWTAKASLDRVRPLAEQNAASKSDLDNAEGNFKSVEAALQQAKAKYDKALLDLSYTTIIAPFSGVAGQSLMREGSYIAAGSSSAKLTYVAKLDPAWIDFSISQNDQDRARQEVIEGKLLPPEGYHYAVELELSDYRRYPHTGKLNFHDPSYNRETGTFLVRAEIANPEAELRPGMFVKAYLKGAQRPNVMVVPQRAVQQISNGHMVWVANDKNQAEIRPVAVGAWLDDDWIINEGLTAGDRVIVDGFMRLGPGMPLKVIAPEDLKSSDSSQPATAE